VDSRIYWVYIMASPSRAIYVGSTSELQQRVWQHKEGVFGGHTSKYKINWLVYYEQLGSATAMVARERELKGWLRRKKVELIELNNPQWLDLSADWQE
jgi:putative endonuclease